jgi:hypothetical protein
MKSRKPSGGGAASKFVGEYFNGFLIVACLERRD